MLEITDADREAAAAFFRDKRTALSVKFTLGHDPSALLEAFARHRLTEREAVIAWLKRENGLCDCFARSEGECGCGAWQDYKTVPLERIWDALEAGEHLK